MLFLTSAQLRALAAFRPKDLDYMVIDRAYGNPGSVVVTFWLHNDSYINHLISPEGELKYV